MAPPTFTSYTTSSPLYSDVATSTTAQIHVSGQYGATKTGFIPSSYTAQVHLALLNLQHCLVASKARIQDIVKLTIYIVNYSSTERAHAPILQKWLNGHRPAMTLIPVHELAKKEIQFEIEAIISAPTAVPAPRSITSSKPRETLDVVVVGAGLSGLAAARIVHAAGLSCVILEARDRVGGKTWTREFKKKTGTAVDVGAAWINDTNQTRMSELTREFGLETVIQNTEGNCVLQDWDGVVSQFAYGSLPDFSTAEKKNAEQIRDQVEADCQKIDVFTPASEDLDTLTFADYIVRLGAGRAAISNATTWTRAMLGVESSEISALFFLNYCKSGGGLLQMRSDRKGGGQYLRLRKGTQGYAKSMAAVLPAGSIKLSTPVLAVAEIGDGYTEVTTAYQTYVARKVIISVPTPVYKTISFTPALPVSKTLLVDSTKYGTYTKAMIAFKSSFWKDFGLCGLSQSFVGPASVIRDTSTEIDNSYTLTCFVVGEPGKEWHKLSSPEQLSVLIDQVAAIYAKNDVQFVQEQFVDWMVSEWNDDPYAGWGCPCPSMGPGVLDAVGSELREPVGDLHFVGTETAGEWKGYMEGAVRSGERGAAEVLNVLKPLKAKI